MLKKYATADTSGVAYKTNRALSNRMEQIGHQLVSCHSVPILFTQPRSLPTNPPFDTGRVVVIGYISVNAGTIDYLISVDGC